MKNKIWSQIWALALNVWRESSRDRGVAILVVFGTLVILVSLIFGQMAVGGKVRVIQNMGFWVIGLWGLFAVLYLGSNIISQELKHHTIYMILSRPVNRTVFLLGKFAGMLIVLLLIFLLLSIVWLGLLLFEGIDISITHFVALGFIFGEWVLLAALSLFFASFTSTLLHNFFLIGITFLGHWSNDLRLFAENAKEIWLKYILKIIYFILPNLEALNFREYALYQQNINFSLCSEGAIVLFLWICSALTAANFIFARRKLI